MEGKIKKFFSKKSGGLAAFNAGPVAKRSLRLGAVLFCVLLGLLLPFHFIQAQGGILGAIMSIGANIVTIFLQVILVISNIFMGIAGLILNWVLSPYFMSLPYTHGGIVDVGWPIVRDFANLFFVVALVFIGLATALRISEYQAKKALPRLIIIALLINFTPVICGLIMDATNILMNFFLEEVSGLKTMGIFIIQQGTILHDVFTHFLDIRYAAAALGKTIVMIAFDWIGGLIFLMFALLFVLRYIMVWVLVIVSPIAFLSKIFPGAQQYVFRSILGWDEWWRQFIEWSLLGITGGFFLYLAEQLIVLAPGMFPAAPPDLAWGWLTIPVVEFINNLLPYGVVLAFLLIGFFTATSTSAMGASFVVNWAKTQGPALGKAALKGGLTPLRKEVLPRLEKGLKTKEAAGWVSGKLRKVPLVRHVGPVSALRRYGEWREDIEKDMGAITGSSYTIGQEIGAGYYPGKKATAALLQITKRGDSQDYFKGMKKRYGIAEDADDEILLENPKFLKETEDLLRTAYRAGLGNDITRRDPRLAAALAGKKGVGFNYEKDNYGKDMTAATAIAKATREARGQHITNWEKDVVANKDVVKTLMKDGGLSAFRHIDDKVKEGRLTTLGTMKKIWEDHVADYAKSKNKAKWDDLTEGEKKEAEEKFIKEYPRYWDPKTGAAYNPRFRSEGWVRNPRDLYKTFPEPLVEKGLGVVPPDFRGEEIPEEELEAMRQAGWVPPKVESAEERMREEAEREEIIKSWPKAEKGMPSKLQGSIEEGEKLISEIKEQEATINSLETAINEWGENLASLRESLSKTNEQINSGRLSGDALTRARENLAILYKKRNEAERQREEIEAKEAEIEPAREAVESIKIHLSELYREAIEPFLEVEEEREKAEKRIKAMKEKEKKVKKSKL